MSKTSFDELHEKLKECIQRQDTFMRECIQPVQMLAVTLRSYKYVHPNSNLTEQLKGFYEKHGYLLVKNNVCHQLLDKMDQRFVDICEGRAKDAVCIMIKDPVLKERGLNGQLVINKLQDFAYDPILSEYCMESSVLNVVENIIGPNITAFHSMLINKPPNTEPDISRHPLHQDLHYFPFRPAHKIVASWTAMQKVDKSNGCLYVIPGSHRSKLYPHAYPEGLNNTVYHGVQGLDHLPKTMIEMEKGDTVFFHPLLLHGSGVNVTKGFRRAISTHFGDSNCNFIDVSNTSQENIRNEVEAITVKYGNPLSFAAVFKLKSRLIRGPPGNFQKLDSHL